MSLVKHSFGDGPTRSSSHLRCLRPLPVPQTYRVLFRTMWPPPLHSSTAPPVQFDWAGKRAIRTDGLRPFTDQLHPLCSSTGQASAPLGSVEV
jgi:hypothetical protein